MVTSNSSHATIITQLLPVVNYKGIKYGIGIGISALFFEMTQEITHLAQFHTPWQVALMTAIAVVCIVMAASILSIRRVLVLEPAVVFR